MSTAYSFVFVSSFPCPTHISHLYTPESAGERCGNETKRLYCSVKLLYFTVLLIQARSQNALAGLQSTVWHKCNVYSWRHTSLPLYRVLQVQFTARSVFHIDVWATQFTHKVDNMKAQWEGCVYSSGCKFCLRNKSINICYVPCMKQEEKCIILNKVNELLKFCVSIALQDMFFTLDSIFSLQAY